MYILIKTLADGTQHAVSERTSVEACTEDTPINIKYWTMSEEGCLFAYNYHIEYYDGE